MRAVDVHGFGGGATLGFVQAGFELAGKMSAAVGFGVNNTLSNRHLLGDNWDSITSQDTNKWPKMQCEVVFGNPPCSGFSTLSTASFRGIDSPINDMMWEVLEYAVRARPQILIFESVQQTFRQGIPLMRNLFTFLREETGMPYHLYHVLHNNASVGGVANRKRYFFVASVVPFGVESCGVDPQGNFYEIEKVPTFSCALKDLEPLGLTMERQPYVGVDHITNSDNRVIKSIVRHSSDWARREIHDGTGWVDGHDIKRSPSLSRALEVIAGSGIEWLPGENQAAVLKKYYEKFGKFPPSWYYASSTKDANGEKIKVSKAEKILREANEDGTYNMGFNQVTRWHWDRPANVVTGGGVHLVFHPTLNRTLTQREVARVQGFPDAWKIWPLRNSPDLGPSWGKGVPVQAGRWVAKFAYESIEGRPGSLQGVPMTEHDKVLGKKFGDMPNETVIDITNDWKTKPLDIVESTIVGN